jgi:hypothetical protein
VEANRLAGSSRHWLCWSTPAIASGCSACSSSDRSPETGTDRSACSRHVTLPGPKKPSSAGSAGTQAANAAAARWKSPVPGNTSAVIGMTCPYATDLAEVSRFP